MRPDADNTLCSNRRGVVVTRVSFGRGDSKAHEAGIIVILPISSDGDEITNHSTNPLLADSDGDGLSDLNELGNNTNPLLADTDYDNLNDGSEMHYGTNPLLPDTDGDGYLDGTEIAMGTDPLDINDFPSQTGTDEIDTMTILILGMLGLLLIISVILIFRIRKSPIAPTPPPKQTQTPKKSTQTKN